jgi:hypothetical protein
MCPGRRTSKSKLRVECMGTLHEYNQTTRTDGWCLDTGFINAFEL